MDALLTKRVSVFSRLLYMKAMPCALITSFSCNEGERLKKELHKITIR